MSSLPDYLTLKRERMTTLREQLRTAEAPAIPISATARVAGGSGVRPLQVREFTIISDSAPALAGYNLGPTAPELLLSALASCLAHTYLVVAVNHGLTYEALEVEVRGCIDYRGVLEVDPATPIPPQELSYEARLTSAASAEQLERLQADVERLCPVLQALRQPLTVAGRLVRSDA